MIGAPGGTLDSPASTPSSTRTAACAPSTASPSPSPSPTAATRPDGRPRAGDGPPRRPHRGKHYRAVPGELTRCGPDDWWLCDRDREEGGFRPHPGHCRPASLAHFRGSPSRGGRVRTDRPSGRHRRPGRGQPRMLPHPSRDKALLQQPLRAFPYARPAPARSPAHALRACRPKPVHHRRLDDAGQRDPARLRPRREGEPDSSSWNGDRRATRALTRFPRLRCAWNVHASCMPPCPEA